MVKFRKIYQKKKKPLGIVGLLHSKVYVVILLTHILTLSFDILNKYDDLFLRELGFSYTKIGILWSIMFSINFLTSFFGGFLADNYSRRKLFILSYLTSSVGVFAYALITEYWFACVILSYFGLTNLFMVGQHSYINDNIPKAQSGLGFSLFKIGNILGIGVLFIINILSIRYGFLTTMRILYISAAIVSFICAVFQFFTLRSDTDKDKENYKSKLPSFREVLRDNITGLKLNFVLLPAYLIIVVLDSLSDSFYNYIVNYYSLDYLGVDLLDFNYIFIAITILSLILGVIVGRMVDIKTINL